MAGGDGVRMTSIALATVIGGATATGSLVAFGKLNENLSSAALAISGRDQINMAAAAAMFGCMGLFMGDVSHASNLAALGGMFVLSGGTPRDRSASQAPPHAHPRPPPKPSAPTAQATRARRPRTRSSPRRQASACT